MNFVQLYNDSAKNKPWRVGSVNVSLLLLPASCPTFFKTTILHNVSLESSEDDLDLDV